MTEESSEEGAQARARERRLHLHNCSPTSNGSLQYRHRQLLYWESSIDGVHSYDRQSEDKVKIEGEDANTFNHK